MHVDDWNPSYTPEELAAAEEFFGVNPFDLIGQPDPRVIEEHELPAESVVRSAEEMPAVLEMTEDAYYALAWLRNADVSGQLNLSGRTVRVAVVP